MREDINAQRVGARNQNVRVMWIHNDGLDKSRILQSHMRPRLALVVGPVDAISRRLFSRPRVDDLRIGRCHRQRPDRSDPLLVEDRLPDSPRVRRLPDPATRRAEVVDIRIARHARHRAHTSTTKRADQPPMHCVQHVRIHILAKATGCDQ